MVIPKVFSNSLIYTGVTILQKCVSFFLLPLYTLYLTPADYGITGVVGSLSSLLAIFTTLGLDSAGSRFYYKYKGDRTYTRRLYGTISCIILINSLLFGGLFILVHKWIIDPLLGNVDFYPYVFLGLLNVMVTPMYLLFQGYLQTIQRGVQFGINAMANFLLHVGLNIVFVVAFKMGALGVLLANLITSVIMFVYVIFAFLRYQIFRINNTIAKESFKYSLPLLPHILANWSNSAIDKLLLNGIRSETDAGLYNLGSQYSSVANTMSIAINNAYVPWFFEKVNNIKENLPQIQKMSEIIIWGVGFICIGMSLFTQDVLDIMISNPEYSGVWRVVPFLICGTIFGSIYFFYVNVLFLNNTGVIFIITVFSIIINIGLNIILIPKLGYMGCGISYMITFFIKSVIAVIISMWKNKTVRFRTWYLYSIGLICSIICISALLYDGLSLSLALAAKFTSLVLIAAIIYIIYKKDFSTLYRTYIVKKYLHI